MALLVLAELKVFLGGYDRRAAQRDSPVDVLQISECRVALVADDADVWHECVCTNVVVRVCLLFPWIFSCLKVFSAPCRIDASVDLGRQRCLEHFFCKVKKKKKFGEDFFVCVPVFEERQEPPLCTMQYTRSTHTCRWSYTRELPCNALREFGKATIQQQFRGYCRVKQACDPQLIRKTL